VRGERESQPAIWIIFLIQAYIGRDRIKRGLVAAEVRVEDSTQVLWDACGDVAGDLARELAAG
jgi:hypothetical protein